MTRSWFRARTIPTQQNIPVRFLFIGLAMLLLAGFTGCDDPPTGGGGGQGGGDIEVRSSSVLDGESGVSLYPTLDWWVLGLDDLAYPSLPPTFDVYFGRGSNPPLVAQDLSDMHYHAGPLEHGEQYRWRVVMHFDGATITSPTWSFRTMEEFRYPLANGNEWQYRVVTTIGDYGSVLDYRVGALSELDCADSCRSYTVTWSEIGVVLDGGASYYYQDDHGLLARYGYTGPTVVLRQTPTAGFVVWQDNRYESLDALLRLLSSFEPSLQTAQPPSEDGWYTSFEYPLEPGNSWRFSPPPEKVGDWIIDKEVTQAGVEISTDAGTFSCFKIRWLYDKDRNGRYEDDIRVVDYVSAAGLVRRDIQIEGVYRYDYGGNIICRCTFESVQELTDFVLH